MLIHDASSNGTKDCVDFAFQREGNAIVLDHKFTFVDNRIDRVSKSSRFFLSSSFDWILINFLFFSYVFNASLTSINKYYRSSFSCDNILLWKIEENKLYKFNVI